MKPIPEGFRSVTPYLCVSDAAKAIEFYKVAFGATERFPHGGAGREAFGHAEILIGDSIIMLADEFPELNFRSPATLGGPSSHFMIYVADVDALVEQAIAAGAKLTKPVKDQFYGDRSGSVEDPFGHHWYISTHIEELTPEEITTRMAAETAQAQQAGA